MTLKLLIIGERASWYRQQGGVWSRSFDERVGSIDGERAPVSRCPWLAEPAAPVDIVLDSQYEDTDITVLAAESSSLAHWLDRRALQRRLVRDNPGSRLQRLHLPGQRSAFSVSARVPNPELQHWLSGLAGITPISVTTLTQAIGDSLDRRSGSCLYLLQHGGTCRHLFFLAGTLCLARCVQVHDDVAGLRALDDTRAHLTSIGIDVQQARVFTLGLSVHLQQRLMESRACRGQICLDPVFDDDEPITLGDWIVSLTAPVPSLRSRVGAVLGSAPWYRRPPLCVPEAVRPFDSLLEPWQQRQLGRRRIALSLGAVLMLGVLGGLTLIQAWQQWQGHRSMNDRMAMLQRRSAELRDAAHQLHPRPVAAVDSLERRQRFDASTVLQADDVLVLLASVLSRHPAIVLDGLHWVIEDEARWTAESAGENASVGTALDVSGHRRHRLPAADQATDRVVLTIAGRVTSPASLRERQRMHAAFVLALEGVPSVLAVEIDLSPLDADAIERQVRHARTPTTALGHAFRLHVLLNATPDGERHAARSGQRPAHARDLGISP